MTGATPQVPIGVREPLTNAGVVCNCKRLVQHVSLFGSAAREDPTPSRHAESTYGFLCRVAGSHWGQFRDLIDAWLANYPESDRASLIGSLASGNDEQFASAFWELYLYESYRRDGWQVEIHPDIESNETHPDFFVRKGGSAYYVEARCVFDGNDRAGTARRKAVYDAINKIDSGPFHVSVTELRVGASSPPTKKLRRDLERWLKTLDPDRVVVSFGRENAQAFEWTHDDWHLRFTPIPRSIEARRSRAERPIGAYVPNEAMWIDDISPLRSALRDKSTRYGRLAHPLLLAMNVMRGSHDDRDTVQALFGTLGFGFDPENPDLEPTPVIIEPGFWGTAQRGENGHVPGVLLVESFAYNRAAGLAPSYWPNPRAKAEIELPPLWPTVDLQQSTFENVARNDPDIRPHEYFDLPFDWPRGEAFPRRRLGRSE